MSSDGFRFLKSALTLDGAEMQTRDVLPWFWSRQAAHRFVIEPIPFAKMHLWRVHQDTGNLVHDSGKFFSIEGLDVHTSFGHRHRWKQPVINQPEVGILGILAKEFLGVLHFLMQVKMEPGNINMVQLSPTLQATRSNFTRVHQGRQPPYLEYFLHRGRGRVLVDVLQSEQGARFHKKRNRNMVVLVEEDVPVLPDFAWLTLGQIQQLLSLDNIVNMDSRTVLGCIPFGGSMPPDPPSRQSNFRRMVLDSVLSTEGALHEDQDLRVWFTEQKMRQELDSRLIPLNTVDEWHQTDTEIRHVDDDYFSIIACRVEADNREVPSWTQPLVKTCRPGLAALIARPIRGVLHFLVQATVEPGNFDVVELAPTIQCTTGDYRRLPPEHRPDFLDDVLNAPPERVFLDALLSEEGGRFFREANQNRVVLVEESFPENVPDRFIWMTLRQMKGFMRYSNYFNVESRCLVACLGFLDPAEEVS